MDLILHILAGLGAFTVLLIAGIIVGTLLRYGRL